MRGDRMEILFRQEKTKESLGYSMLDCLGIEGCLFKEINLEQDRSSVTKKSHYHTSTEIHIIQSGYQLYGGDEERIRVGAGEFLIIPPSLSHIAAEEDPKTKKYALSFRLRAEAPIALPHALVVGTLSSSAWHSIAALCEERKMRSPYYVSMIDVRVWETVLEIFRTAALLATEPTVTAFEENERLLLAKQYIADNVRRGITLSELADYVCLGEKQLTRVFRSDTGMTAMEYIRKQRCREIEKLLADPSLSLRAISEIMHFDNEYYFNAFFKKYAGMPPGAYRRAVTN